MLDMFRGRRFSIAVPLALVAFWFGALSPAAAGQPGGRQAMDADFETRIREWTTRPEFLSPLVDHLPASDTVPSPRDIIGHHVGAPRELTYYPDLLAYYRALAGASPRVAIRPIGTTDEGREMVVVTIASEATLAEIERHRQDLARLADPRSLDEDEAQAVIARAKPIYLLMAGLHSGETGPPEMLMELAYRLAVEEGPRFDRIRDNLIVALIPAAEPDGRDRYVDWYYRHLIDIADEDERIGGPPYWEKYIFHDNNRDINYSQQSMRNVLDWYLAWHPPVMHDLHESVPFLYHVQRPGAAEPDSRPDRLRRAALVRQLRDGAADRLRHAGRLDARVRRHVVARLPRVHGVEPQRSDPLLRDVRQRRRHHDDAAPQDRGQHGRAGADEPRVVPALTSLRGGRVVDAKQHQLQPDRGACRARARRVAPARGPRGYYRKSANAVADGERNPPHGFVIPAGQRDMTRAATLVELLRIQGVEVGRTQEPLTLGDETHPAGSYVIQGGQPYFRLAKTLLGSPEFPDESLRTYDDTGWTMGLMHRTPVVAIDDPAVLAAPVVPVDDPRVSGTIAGGAGRFGYAVAHHGSNHLTTLRYRLGAVAIDAAEEPFEAAGVEFPPGSFIIPAPAGSARGSRVRSWVRELGLTAAPLDERPEVATHPVDLPRLAIYSTWGDTQEVGWVRHAFDRFEIPFDLIFKERVRAGNLRANYDLVLVPNQGGSAKGLVFDIEPRGGPRAYTKTDRYRFLGDYGSSPDVTGGMGIDGVLELQRFVAAGGVLVTLGAASHFPPEYGLTREIDARRPGSGFYAPGPLVEARIEAPEHPIFYGYETGETPVRYANGPLLDVPQRFRDDWVVMTFRDRVLSGHLRGAAQIDGRAAVVDVPRGDGRVVLFATNPCYRWQNHGEFGMLFNTLLHYNDLGRRPDPGSNDGTKP